MTAPELPRGVPKGTLTAIVLLLLVEVGLARQDWVWRFNPRSSSGIVDALEAGVIRRAPTPSVIVMGSSRARDAIAPRTLEGELGLPRGSVLNLSIVAGTPFDGLVLYRRNRARFRRARTLVFAVEDWHLNAGFPPTARDRRFATFAERIGVFDAAGTISMLVGWAWRSYDAQEPLRDLLLSVRHRPSAAPIGPDGRMQWRQTVVEEGPAHVEIDSWVDQFYATFRLSAGRLQQLKDLVDLARRDGLEVVLVQLPWRDAYVDAVEGRHRREFRAIRRAIRGVDTTRTVLWDRGSALGLPETWFEDYGHLTPRGADAMTKRLASTLRELAALD